MSQLVEGIEPFVWAKWPTAVGAEAGLAQFSATEPSGSGPRIPLYTADAVHACLSHERAARYSQPSISVAGARYVGEFFAAKGFFPSPVQAFEAGCDHAANRPGIEELCALIKAADDAAAGNDYMLDSDDCIAVLRGEWKGAYAADHPQLPKKVAASPLNKPVTGWYSELVHADTGEVIQNTFRVDAPVSGPAGVDGFEWRSTFMTSQSKHRAQRKAQSAVEHAQAIDREIQALQDAQDRLLEAPAKQLIARIDACAELDPEKIAAFTAEITNFPRGFFRTEVTTALLRKQAAKSENITA